MPEKPDERLARYVVSRSLGVPVTRYDDGSEHGQVDALIHLGPEPAALEIVADHEQAFNAQWAALEQVSHRVDVPRTEAGVVGATGPSRQVKDVAAALPELMLRYQDNDDADEGHRIRDRRHLPDNFRRLGIRMVWPLENDRRSAMSACMPRDGPDGLRATP